MILVSAYVENFGCLSEFRMDFTPGLNTVMRDNGTGKTTFAAFLLAMLYGLPQTTVTSVEKNERKHYTPWQGGRFGGSITFRVEGRRYRAVRYFGEKESGDSFTLYNADTELVSTDYTKDLGEELFGLSRIAFQKSVFFRKTEKDSFAASDDEIIEKLSSYVEASSGVVSYDEAIKTLEKQRKVYIKTGNRGKIGELESKIEEAKIRLFESTRDAEALQALYVERDKLTHAIADGEKEEERLTAAIDAATRAETEVSLVRHAATLKNEMEAATRARTACEATFGERLPGEEDMLSLDKLAATADALRSRPPLRLSDDECNESHTILERFGGALPDPADENGMLAYTASEARVFPPMPAPPTKTEIPFPTGGIVLAAILTAVFAVSGIFLLQLLLLLLIPAVLFLYFPLSYRKKKAVTDADFEQKNAAFREALRFRLHEEAVEKERRLNVAILARKSYLSLKERAERADTENARIKREADEAEALLFSRLAAFGEHGSDRNALLLSLRRRVEGYRALCERENAAVRAHTQFLQEHPTATRDLTARSKDGMQSVDALERERLALREGRAAARKALDAIARRILPMEASAKRAEEIFAVKAEAEDELRNANAKATAIERAERFLTEARDRLSSRYLGRMQESFSRHLSYFLPVWDSRPVLDSHLALKLENGGARYLPAYYSDGTRDILALCMHLSLSEALIGEEKAPLFFDDNFADLDDDKLSRVREFLTEEAKTKQILYFTCHSSRCF